MFASKEKKPVLPVKVLKSKLCPHYLLAVIDGVRIGPSPDWMAKRLESVGIRSINNVVDATNYVLMERGQPLHAFDRSKIRGDRVQVRAAFEGETLETLDGVSRHLKPGDLVIADAEGPIALAGVMGGRGSQIDAETTSVALECAFFDPATVRKTARRLDIQTDSSHRFERRVDPDGVAISLERAVELIRELAGGILKSVSIHRDKKSLKSSPIRFSSSEVEAVLGASFSAKEIQDVLKSLHFALRTKGKGAWEVIPPSHRGDIGRSIDLVEEIVRVAGLDRVPVRFPSLDHAPIPFPEKWKREGQVKNILADLGFQEMIHYSFIAPDSYRRLRGSADVEGVFLENPLGLEYSLLRPSLLPSLLEAASHHHRHSIFDFRSFELRKTFQTPGGGGALEGKALSGILTGARVHSHWSSRSQETDFYDVKGVVERILSEWGREVSFEKGNENYLHPGKQARILVDGKRAGTVGEIHPEVLARFDLKKTAFVFEIDWESLASLELLESRFREYSRFPVVERDLALILDERVEAGTVADFIRDQDDRIQQARIFDLYRGEPVPLGKKSLAFSIRLSCLDRTLTDEEVQEVCRKVVEGVKEKFEAEIRH